MPLLIGLKVCNKKKKNRKRKKRQRNRYLCTYIGIGARGTRLTSEKPLGEQTLEILAPHIDKNAPVLVLPSGTHRFSFAFVVPNVRFTKLS